jgi:AcrR family transcriptional regulator
MAPTSRVRTKRSSLALRQRALRAESMRREIIDAAMIEFGERGVADTSIANIADRLGTGGSTIYHYFASKQAILEQAVDEALREIAGSVVAAVGNPPTSADEFRYTATDLADRITEMLVESPHLIRLIGFAAWSSDTELQSRWTTGVSTVTDLFEQGLRNGVDAGVLRADLDTEPIARALIGIPLGMIMSQGGHSIDREVWRRTGRALITMVIDGILPER